jgi:serine phosphatase RsbU (regulator of sigma subunit)/anti-sigma regulatory factor (Ser/Thr protein kinase)/CHASE3 domain sensor protein
MTRAREVARRFGVRIRTQAILISVVPLTFLLLLCVIASVLQSRTEQMAAWSQRSTSALSAADAIQKSITVANRSLIDYTRGSKPASLDGFDTGRRELPAQEAELLRLVRDDPAQERRAARYVALTNQLMSDVLERYLALWRAGKKADAAKLGNSPRVRRMAADWENVRADFGLTERQSALARYAALHRELASLGAVLIGASIAGIVLTVFVTGQFGLRIARRLLRLTENARRLGSGEPAAVIAGADEIADLDRVYHEMTRRLRETLHQKDEALAAFERAHHVASTLQRALLPQGLPVMPGIAFDGVYEPGRSEAQVGGDWYDALRLADGRVLITIGDVAGSGLQAAVIMAAMRQVIRGVAQVYADPATMIDAADRTLKAEHPDRFVTAFVGVYDPVAQTLSYCSAGHPPPLIRGVGGSVSDLPATGLPLGLRTRDESDPRTAEIPPGSMLLFYTDGLIESTKDVLDGERRLRAAFAELAVVTRTDLARAIHDEVLREGANDDVAILAMRLEPVAAGLAPSFERRWHFDTCDLETAQRARALFASLLAAAGVLEEDVFTAELIFGELLSNAVRYAPGTVDVVLDWHGASTAIVHFLDRGPGFVVIPRLPSDLLSERGRGLFLVWSLSHDFNVTKRTDGGSHVRVVLTPRRKRGLNGAAVKQSAVPDAVS